MRSVVMRRIMVVTDDERSVESVGSVSIGSSRTIRSTPMLYLNMAERVHRSAETDHDVHHDEKRRDEASGDIGCGAHGRSLLRRKGPMK